ncbi:MAG TPA: glycosyltransferase family 4 protein [Solirubrobacteraceae bacterium]|nr:glycosyltransferase family 4 protein [Solirubrobacteraceae bacterium]
MGWSRAELGEAPARAGGEGAEPLRVAVVGISLSGTCGVRDHATLLTGALAADGVSCSWHWLTREQSALAGARSEIAGFVEQLRDELARERPAAVVLHYSVFAYSHKGLPLFVRPVFEALRESGVPVLAVLHEFAYPWRYGGWRGAVWAVSQRAAMVEVMRVAATVLVTADVRARWLSSRPWLAKRAVVVAPVYSNLPPPRASSRESRDGRTVGLFGYSYQGAALALILDAFADLTERGVAVRLRLLGAPGPQSPGGEAWREQAQARGIADALSFSGALPAQELSDQLAACEVLLFADAAGPSSRKGTLAGSLASGRPLVALDGPMGWRALIDAGAIIAVPPSARALADAVGGLLADESAREELGERGLAFYRREMALERTAETVMGLLAGGGPAGSPAGERRLRSGEVPPPAP